MSAGDPVRTADTVPLLPPHPSPLPRGKRGNLPRYFLDQTSPLITRALPLRGTQYAGFSTARRAFMMAFALLLGTTATQATEIEVSVDPNPPASGESFRLAFIARGEIAGKPDFAPLDANFDVMSRNEKTSIQWQNGKMTRNTTWVLEVVPRGDGPLIIPAITFGADKSAPYSIAPANTASAPAADDSLFLEVDAAPKNPYLQQELIYTIRLWRRFELSNASLSEPKLSVDALVRPVGEDRHFQADKDGKVYEVIERRFAVFPQASGAAEIKPVTVTAQVMTRGQSLFDIFGQSVKTRRLTSPAIPLEIRPVPASFPKGATWLPARRVRLNEEWDPITRTANAGEPITRTMTLWAEGLTQGQLPSLTTSLPATLKAYPDQPRLSEEQREGVFTAVHQEKIALIPSSAGAVELPRLRIPWWNTDKDVLEFAELSATTLTATNNPAAPTRTTALPPLMPKVGAAASPPRPLVIARRVAWWNWPGWCAIAMVSTLGWALTPWWLRRRSRQGSRELALANDAPARSLRAARDDVQKAARRNDAVATRNALLVWATQHWPLARPATLGGVAEHASPALARAVEALAANLYAAKSTAWSGAQLSNAVETEPAPTAQATHASAPVLPPLWRIVRS